MAKKNKNTANIANQVTTVYVGRSLLGLSQYTTFAGGVIPEFVKQKIAEYSAIGGLIVPVTELQDARKNIATKGHILNHYALQLEKQLNNKEA